MPSIPYTDPANRVVNPGFEDTPLVWTLTGGAALYPEGYLSATSMGLYGQVGGVGDTGSSTIGRIKNLMLARNYEVYLRVRRRPSGMGTITLVVSVDRGDGAFLNVGSYDDPNNDWVELAYSFTGAGGPDGRIQLAVPLPIGFLVSAYYDVDAVVVQDVTGPAAPAPSADQTQPENTPGPVRFQRGLLDDVHGTLHKEGNVRRDYDLRLRDARDTLLPDRGWLHWGPPRTRNRRRL